MTNGPICGGKSMPRMPLTQVVELVASNAGLKPPHDLDGRVHLIATTNRLVDDALAEHAGQPAALAAQLGARR